MPKFAEFIFAIYSFQTNFVGFYFGFFCDRLLLGKSFQHFILCYESVLLLTHRRFLWRIIALAPLREEF